MSVFSKITDVSPVFGSSPATVLPPDAVTSWYMTEMIDPLGKDTIYFDYALSISAFNTITSQTKYLLDNTDVNCDHKNTDDNSSSNFITGFHVSKIRFRNGTVICNSSSTTRCDLPSDTALTSIIICNADSSFYKKFQLYQRYLTVGGLTCDPDHPENARLMLDSIIISDRHKADQRYAFTYNESIGMPSRLSYDQDHWGYYNGANNGTDFIPLSDLETISGATDVITGADREANPMYSQALTLQSIAYPTGGRTEFEYENNSISNPPAGLGLVLGSRTFAINPNSNPVGSGPRLYIDTTFVMSDNFDGLGGVNGSISINNGGGDCAMSAGFGCPIVNISGPDDVGGNILTNQDMFLPQGTYEVTVDLTSVTDPSIIANFFFQISWDYDASTSDSTRTNVPVGGLRIKKMTDYDVNNKKAQVRQYTYLVPDSVNLSSGTLLSAPQYVSSITILQTTKIFGTDDETTDECPYITISSGSNLPLLQTQSSYVGYQYVQEILGDSGEFGKNEYEYTSPDLIPDRLTTAFPYAPATSFDWKRGQLVHLKQYRYDGSELGYRLIAEKINNYADNETTVVQGVHVGQNLFNNSSVIEAPVFATAQFSTEAGWFPLVSDTDRIYDQNSLSHYSQTIHRYAYNSSYFLPTSDTTTDSKGQNVVVNTRYPLDYAGLTGSDGFTQGILDLQNKNMIATPVEKYVQLMNSDSSNLRTTSAILTTYKSDLPNRDTLWASELIQPKIGFSPTHVSGGSIVKDNIYQVKILFPRYDPQGNIVEQQKVSDFKLAYLWDYKHTYPIAEAKSADSSSIAYTSFEADGSGNWTIGSSSRDSSSAITGSHSYLLDSNISKSGLGSSITYVVSYWTTNNSPFSIAGTMAGYPVKGKTIDGWTLYTHRVTGDTMISINGNGHIDELRLYPLGAQMTTYTYAPLVGMTGQCDVGNRITYYEYDGLGRLIRVRDQDKNILKTLDYQYRAPGGCGSNCYIVQMQTLAGTNTISYPVGVFNVHGKLLGNAPNQMVYDSLWNADTANAHVGTLSAGVDSMHFQVALDSGKSLPTITGCRYYQYDLPWTQLDGVRNFNGVYVDFGDSTGMYLGKNLADTPTTLASNTTYKALVSTNFYNAISSSNYSQLYLIHTYPDTSTKTITFYHNDATENSALDNANSPATSLLKVRNLRGNLPANTDWIGGSAYQISTASSVANIGNWNKISSIKHLWLNRGDGINPFRNIGYTQDFLLNDKGLQTIEIQNIDDTSFRLTRLRTDWNTYYTNLQELIFNDNSWNRENISGLSNLWWFNFTSTKSANNAVVDSILIQIAAGPAQNVRYGVINISWSGCSRTSASDAAISFIKSRSWVVSINGIGQ